MPYQMTLELPDELWQWVEANAEDEGLLPDEYIRNILRMEMAMELAESEEEDQEEEDEEGEDPDDGTEDGKPGTDDGDSLLDKDEEEK